MKNDQTKKMPKELQINTASRIIAEHTDIDIDQVDLTAEIDSSLHFDENWERLKDELGIKTEKDITKEIEDWKEKIQEKRVKQFREEFRETLEEVKEEGKEVEKYYEGLRNYVKALVHSDQGSPPHSLILFSQAGYGKSYQVQAKLKEEGLEYGRDYEVMVGYSTPLELYHTLYKNRKKTLVLDDVQGIAHDQKALSLLKACTWSVGKNRTVSYGTTSSKLEAPKMFDYQGQLIICLNREVNDPDFDALKSRSIYYELELTYQELIGGIFPKIAENKLEKEKAEELVDFIRQNSNPACNLEIRDLMKSINLYKYAEKTEGENWEGLVKGLIDSDSDLDLVWRLMNNSNKSVEDKVKDFKRETGKSRKTYYNYKKKLQKLVDKNV